MAEPLVSLIPTSSSSSASVSASGFPQRPPRARRGSMEHWPESVAPNDNRMPRFELNETKLILIVDKVVQVSLELVAGNDDDVKVLLQRFEQAKDEITDTMATVLQLESAEQQAPDVFTLQGPGYALKCYHQDWSAMLARWSWSLDGKAVEGCEKKWKFVFCSE